MWAVELGRRRRPASARPASARTRARACRLDRACPWRPACRRCRACGIGWPLSVMKMTSVLRSRSHSLSRVEQLADVVVDVGDHAVVGHRPAALSPLPSYLLGVLLRADVGRVRGVGADVGEERLLGLPLLIDPAQWPGEEHVGAEALGLLEAAVVQDGRIEVLVARRVAATAGIRLADAAGAVDEDFVEAAAVGLIRRLRRRGAICRRCRSCSRPT